MRVWGPIVFFLISYRPRFYLYKGFSPCFHAFFSPLSTSVRMPGSGSTLARKFRGRPMSRGGLFLSRLPILNLHLNSHIGTGFPFEAFFKYGPCSSCLKLVSFFPPTTLTFGRIVCEW